MMPRKHSTILEPSDEEISKVVNEEFQRRNWTSWETDELSGVGSHDPSDVMSMKANYLASTVTKSYHDWDNFKEAKEELRRASDRLSRSINPEKHFLMYSSRDRYGNIFVNRVKDVELPSRRQVYDFG